MTSISSRFDQKGFKIFSNVEQFLFKACKGEEFSDEMTKVCEFFYGNFDKAELEGELLTLQQLYQSAIGSEAPTIDNIKRALLTLSNAQRMLINAVCRLF